VRATRSWARSRTGAWRCEMRVQMASAQLVFAQLRLWDCAAAGARATRAGVSSSIAHMELRQAQARAEYLQTLVSVQAARAGAPACAEINPVLLAVRSWSRSRRTRRCSFCSIGRQPIRLVWAEHFGQPRSCGRARIAQSRRGDVGRGRRHTQSNRAGMNGSRPTPKTSSLERPTGLRASRAARQNQHIAGRTVVRPTGSWWHFFRRAFRPVLAPDGPAPDSGTALDVVRIRAAPRRRAR